MKVFSEPDGVICAASVALTDNTETIVAGDEGREPSRAGGR